MKTFRIAALALALAVAGSANAATNLIVNGDFESPIGDPNTAIGRGFDTDYAYRSGASNTGADSMYDEGTWTIGTNPYLVHNLWIDHPFASGKALILNGKTNNLPSLAWSQEFAVSGGTYAFSYDVINVYAGAGESNIQFDFSSNGGSYVTLDSVTTSSSGADAGIPYNRSGAFNVGAGTLRVSFRNSVGLFGGNDFAIDNISVTAVPEPGTWALMI